VVPAIVHHRIGVLPNPADHQDVAYRWCILQGLVGELLERYHLAAAIAAVGGDHCDSLLVVDSIPKRLGRESTEDH